MTHANRRLAWLLGSAVALVACWAALWGLRSYWNPLFFFGLWTAATIMIRTLAGDTPLPLARQAACMALSIPLWWWFEKVNSWVNNWHYHSLFQYGPVEYFLFASLTFSTVVPALDAFWRLAFRLLSVSALTLSHPPSVFPLGSASARPRLLISEIIAGIAAQGLVIAAPAVFYPLVWIAPFLLFDALVAMRGGPHLLSQMLRREYRLAVALGVAGVACGFCWELWNWQASPKWTYSIPYLHFFPIFEMPVLGYGGYVPFTWAVYQFVNLCRSLFSRFPRATAPVAP